MIQKLKKFLKKHRKLVKLGILILVVLVLLIVLYKSLFYSNSEKASYGVRLRDISENKISKTEIKSLEKESSEIEKISSARINIKGRIIKFFITFDNDTTNEDIKNKFNEVLSKIDESKKGYYDIEFYSIKENEEKETYPVTGYKHKNRSEISFDEV